MKPTIFVVGEVSSGKSSFVNAIAGGFISTVSLQRETMNPQYYQFSKNGNEDNIKKISDKLEKIHNSNEETREKIKELKEEKISTTDKRSSDDEELPIRYDLQDFRLFDLPGINDSEDLKNVFFQVIKNLIDQCTLLIYVTEASRAFVSLSEIENFKKIMKLVEEQNKRGLYVELIVVVSKYDDKCDKDLNQIYTRIKQKIGNIQTFRCSNHKIMIDCIKKHKLNISVPKFMKKEMANIIKNANILMTQTIIKKLKKNVINHDDLQYNNNFDDNDSDNDNDNDFCTVKEPGDNKIEVDGDLDNLIDYIKFYQKNFRNNIEQTKLKYMEQKMKIYVETSYNYNFYKDEYNEFLNKCKREYVPHAQLETIYFEKKIAEIPIIYKELHKKNIKELMHTIKITYETIKGLKLSDENFCKGITKFIDELKCDNSIKSSIIITFLKSYDLPLIRNHICNIFLTKMNKDNIMLMKGLCNEIFTFDSMRTDPINDKIEELLKYPDAWNEKNENNCNDGIGYMYYNEKKDNMCLSIAKYKSKNTDSIEYKESGFITNLKDYGDLRIRRLIIIALTPMDFLRCLDKSLTYDNIKERNHMIYKYLKFQLSNNTTAEMLKHKLFNHQNDQRFQEFLKYETIYESI
jgi:GTPase Era involved in 16S rRNA processing